MSITLMNNTLLCQQSTYRNFKNLSYLKLTLDNWPLSAFSDEAEAVEIIYDEL